MGQRSTLCMQQMRGLNSETCDSCFHPIHGFFTGNSSDYTSRSECPALVGPGNCVDLFHHFRNYHERVALYGNQYSYQNCHAIQNLGVDALDPLNSYNSNVLVTPAGGNFYVHQSSFMAEQVPSFINQVDNGIIMEEFGSHNLVNDDRRTGKTKVTEMIPGIYYNLNKPAGSSSTANPPNCGGLLWGRSYESLSGLMDPTVLSPPEYERRFYLLGAEGSHRSMRIRSVTGCLQPESAVLPHQNYLLPGSYMFHPIQPTSNAWMSQLENGFTFVGGDNWNYNNTYRYLPGRSQNSGCLLHSTNRQAYTGNSSITNSAMLFHRSPFPSFNQANHNVQVHSCSHPPAHMAGPFQHLVSNLNPVNSNLSGDEINARSSIPHLNSADQIYRPLQQPHHAQHFLQGSLRLLSAEDAALMDFTELFSVRNAIDQHEEMRLDIDDMSYEELLALEDQIGVVKTGLTEEFIIKYLKMRAHVPVEAAISVEPSSRLSIENESCSICQVQYEEDEIIGTLDCGHEYHADCIKHWLLIKNLCPVCKTSALANKDRRELK